MQAFAGHTFRHAHPSGPQAHSLPGISSRAWEHPDDRGALVALRRLRGFDTLLERLSGLVNERAVRLVYLGSAIWPTSAAGTPCTRPCCSGCSSSVVLTAIPLGGLGVRAILAGLREWSRKSELSADRAGLLATQDPSVAFRVHMKLASGSRLENLDPTSFFAQGIEYAESGDLRDSVLRLLLIEAESHPFARPRRRPLEATQTRSGRARTPSRSWSETHPVCSAL